MKRHQHPPLWHGRGAASHENPPHPLRPEEFAAACALEKEVQKIDPFCWFHVSCVPLGEVDFTQPEYLFTDRACSSGGVLYVTSANVVEYLIRKDGIVVGKHRHNILCKPHWEKLEVFTPYERHTIEPFGYDEEEEFWSSGEQPLEEFMRRVSRVIG